MNFGKECKFEFICAMFALIILMFGGTCWALSTVFDFQDCLRDDWYNYEYETNLVLSWVCFGYFLFGLFASLLNIAGIIRFCINKARKRYVLVLNLITPVVTLISWILYKYYEAKLPNW